MLLFALYLKFDKEWKFSTVSNDIDTLKSYASTLFDYDEIRSYHIVSVANVLDHYSMYIA